MVLGGDVHVVVVFSASPPFHAQGRLAAPLKASQESGRQCHQGTSDRSWQPIARPVIVDVLPPHPPRRYVRPVVAVDTQSYPRIRRR